VGRLQTDADRERVIDGLEVSQSAGQAKGAEGFKVKLAQTIGRLAPRWFVVRSAYLTDGAVLLTPRRAMSFMRGPMTRSEIRKAREMSAAPRLSGDGHDRAAACAARPE
jgi:sirohydrochlorin ferrochelatase